MKTTDKTMNCLFWKKILAVVMILALWEILPRSGLVDPIFIPPFSAVLVAIKELGDGGALITHTLVSLERALGGLLAAVGIGLPLGLLLGGWFPRLQRSVEPLMELLAQANPLILAHIIVFFLGIGRTARIFIIAWLCVWPITFSAIAGIRSVNPLLLKTAGSLALGRLHLFIKVILPSALPSVFTGVRLAAGYAFIMLIASEMMGARSGLGWLVAQSQENYHVTRVFACATVITFLAAATDTLLRILEKRIVVRNTAENEDHSRLESTT